jgi:hypothetical protein
VQELWANLIANATDINAKIEIKKMHIDLLKSLNGLEARVLAMIFARYDNGRKAVARRRWAAERKRWPTLKSEELWVGLENMKRLGLVGPSITQIEILNHSTIDKWVATVDSKNIVPEFYEGYYTVNFRANKFVR